MPKLVVNFELKYFSFYLYNSEVNEFARIHGYSGQAKTRNLAFFPYRVQSSLKTNDVIITDDLGYFQYNYDENDGIDQNRFDI